MVAAINGYERTSSNYFWQCMKGVGIGIVTLGMFYTVPYSSATTLRVVVFDTETDKVLFCRDSSIIGSRPSRADDIGMQLRKIFDGYFGVQK